MAKRKKTTKKSDFKQTDIVSAFRGKEVVFDLDEQDDKVETPKKSLSLFDFVDDIRKHKTGTLLDSEENQSSWNSYMILQTLSMKEADVPIANFFNKYQGTMTKKQLYTALIYLVPTDKRFYKWIKNKSEVKHELSSFVAEYFECSQTQAIEYIHVMGEEWAESIKDKFGGMVSKKKK
jgi:succinate dehydrogenase flavin-adding protein (antitoxin of CptAB toxin-antitoxin module)